MVQPPSKPPYTPPWWLGGEERCEVCLQPYVREMEMRCVNCDGPHCPFCECASCRSEEEDGKEERA